MDREISGLIEAMDYFEISTATIITQNQSDTFVVEGKTIDARPFYEWATDSIEL